MSNKCPNLKEEEKQRILQLALKYKKIIEGKETDTASRNDRNRIWEKVTNEFNATALHKRNIKQIKTFYKNAKSSLKKHLSEEKNERQKTGGGTFMSKVDNKHPLLEIVNEEITPVFNEFDSSSEYFHELSQDTNLENNFQELLREESQNEADFANKVINTQEIETQENASNSALIEREALPSTSRKWSRKRKNNDELRQYVEMYSELKKQKLETDILKNKRKAEMFEKKTKLLDLQIKQLVERN